MTTAWDGRPPAADRPGYHWVRRVDVPGCEMPPVIWTWRPEADEWRWKGGEKTPAEMAQTHEWVAHVSPCGEVERLRDTLEDIARMAVKLPQDGIGHDILTAAETALFAGRGGK